MLPYVMLAAYTGFVSLLNCRGYVGRKGFLVAVMVPACSLLALRGPSVGEDTSMYLHMARIAGGMPWSSLSTIFGSVIWNMDEWGFGSSVNVGYLVFCKLLLGLVNSPEFVQVVCAVLTFIGFGRFIYRKEENVALSYWVFLCGGMFMFAFNGMRQMLAFALAIQSFVSLDEKRYIGTAIWILLGSLIHTSVLIVFALLVLSVVLKNGRAFVPVLVGCIMMPVLMPVLRVLAAMISAQYASYFENNYWDASVGGMVFVWILALICLAIVAKRDESSDGRIVSAMTAVYLSFSVMAFGVSIFERVALYPQVFTLLLYPRALKLVGEKNRWWFCALIVSLLFLLFVSYSMNPMRLYSTFL